MNHVLLVLILFLFFFPNSCGFSYDELEQWQDQRGSAVRGLITDELGGAIAGASLELKDLHGNAHTTITDNSGMYRFKHLAADTYVISIAQPGFTPLQARVKVMEGQTMTVNLVLRVSAHDQDVSVSTTSVSSGPRLSCLRE